MRVLFAIVAAALFDCGGMSTSRPDSTLADGVSEADIADDTAGQCPPPSVVCSGTCVSLQSDPQHCGACDNACLGLNAGCVAGQCRTISCTGNLTRCGVACVDTQSDPMNCGRCGVTCSAGQLCVVGTCSASGCPLGQQRCGGICTPTDTDPQNCGICGRRCTSGETCSSGVCTSSACLPPLTVCSGVCVNTIIDHGNCGACGRPCAALETCTGATCALSLCTEMPQVMCDDGCRDLSSDVSDCGACGAPCPPAMACEVGVCRCLGGETNCGGRCVDTSEDPANCGSCGHACGPGRICLDGACACPAGMMDCGGGCINVSADATNCGGCGSTCPSGERCIAGSCQNCTAPFRLCADGCIDPQEYSRDCSGCDVICIYASACNRGGCRNPPPAAYGIATSPQAWVDACALPGAEVILEHQDGCAAGPIALPFAFAFFGVPYSSFEVSPDGYLSFIGRSQCYASEPVLPSSLAPHPAIVAYGRRLATRDSGVCYGMTGSAPNRQLVVETVDAYFPDNPASHISFEVILSEGGNTVDVLYRTLQGVGSTGGTCTVGLQNSTATAGVVFEANTEGTLSPGLGLRLSPM